MVLFGLLGLVVWVFESVVALFQGAREMAFREPDEGGEEGGYA
jgi:hypothetical protein